MNNQSISMTLSSQADEAIIEKTRIRVLETIQRGLQLETSTELSERFLRRHVNKKVKLAILYADIEDSTRMSLTLPTQVLASIVQVFSQEMTMITAGYGGYVLKYVGDAIIAFFPAEFDCKKACNNAVNSSRSMVKIVADGLNPVFKNKGFPTIGIKLGMDFGENLVVLYGRDPASSYIDIIGSSISVASKINVVATPGQIVVGENMYKLLDPYLKQEFSEIQHGQDVYSFKDPANGKLYKLYTTS